jgi:cobalt-precorrin-5B (C1)-methyltransferase
VNSEKSHKPLRSGFTTGAAAAAAVRAALLMLTRGEAPSAVYVPFLSEGGATVKVHAAGRGAGNQAVCTVIKDGGDDPDATHGAEIGARVTLVAADCQQGPELVLDGGIGVGRVTLPGLEIPPGQAAINPGPRRMIEAALTDILGPERPWWRVQVEIFVPRGEQIARRTLNARLGILGGISILGTTGIVRPMSHEAYTATIRAAMRVARAEPVQALVLTTGRRSERFAQALWPQRSPRAFVQIGDYFGFAMQTAAALGLSSATLAVFFGKGLKMAQGLAHTHTATAPMTLADLGRWIRQDGGDSDLARAVAQAHTARQALERIMERSPRAVDVVGRRLVAAARRLGQGELRVGAVIFDFQGRPVFQETP